MNDKKTFEHVRLAVNFLHLNIVRYGKHAAVTIAYRVSLRLGVNIASA